MKHCRRQGSVDAFDEHDRTFARLSLIGAGALAMLAGTLSLTAQTAQPSAAVSAQRPAAAAGGQGWPGYGGGPQQIRYSTLTQINKSNVKQLQVAWMFDTGEPGAMQTQPIVVDGVLYGYTPTH